MPSKTGTNTFQLTATQIATKSLLKCGAIDAEETAQGFEIDNAIEDLNLILKSHSNHLHLWKRKRIILFTRLNTEKYFLGPGGDESCYEDDFIGTKISTITASGATILPLDDTTGMLGASSVFPNGGPDFVNTAGWGTTNSGVISISGGDFLLTNGIAAKGSATIIVPTVVGRSYISKISFVLGTSSTSILRFLDGALAVIDTVTLSATGTAELSFTATETTVLFQMICESGLINETCLLDSISLLDLTTGDNIGIKLDDNSRQWTRIVTVDSSIQVRSVDALTDGTSVGDNVYTFTTLADRPLRILETPRYQLNPLNALEAEPESNRLSRNEYDKQSTKDTSGAITNIYFSPEIDENTSGDRRATLFTWPISDDVDQILKFSTLDPIDDITDGGDLIDMPVEWTNGIVWVLADQIVEEYTSDDRKITRINTRATNFMNELRRFDQDRQSIKLTVRRR